MNYYKSISYLQDKKKKKPKKGKKDIEKVETTNTISAAGRAILLRQQLLAEEEARIKKLKEEEEERIRLEEEREEAERKAIEEEKERKRKAKHDKVEAQRAAGTYMTKAEKEKFKKAQARLESMKQFGMVKIPGLNNETEKNVSSKQTKEVDQIEAFKTLVESNVKNGIEFNAKNLLENDDDGDVNVKNIEITEKEEEKEEKEEVADSWENEDWEKKLQQTISVNESNEEDVVEDLIELDKRKNLENLKQLGVERAKREEDARLKKFYFFLINISTIHYLLLFLL
jgi:hypothetical protein